MQSEPMILGARSWHSSLLLNPSQIHCVTLLSRRMLWNGWTAGDALFGGQ